MKQALSMIGFKVGRLEVTGRGDSPDNRPRWLCRCECGTTDYPVRGVSLRRGDTQSCGCIRREVASTSHGATRIKAVDMTDERHGMLKVLYRTDEKYHGGWLWECQCDCGNRTKATPGQIRSGHKASCGCARGSGVGVRSAQVRVAANEWKKAKTRTDPKFRLCQVIGAQMRNTLKKKGAVKIGRTFTILGYTPAALEARLRETLPDGSMWDDFMAGRLHIEHIRPLSSFDFNTEYDPDFKLAWALSNLRLLPALENWSKGARWDTLAA